nr:histidine phosphatase family protein [Shewanella olleyana]
MFSSGLIAAEKPNSSNQTLNNHSINNLSENHSTDNQSVNNQNKTFILVRHAEKQTGKDPILTQDGTQRANRLANMLSSVPLTAIYSTNYQRTQLTALPTSELVAVNITDYNPSQLSSFAEKLKSSPHSHSLIVGHSNTTPELVSLLGGDAGTEINEKSEFGRVYILTSKDGDMSTLVLHY